MVVVSDPSKSKSKVADKSSSTSKSKSVSKSSSSVKSQSTSTSKSVSKSNSKSKSQSTSKSKSVSKSYWKSQATSKSTSVFKSSSKSQSTSTSKSKSASKSYSKSQSTSKSTSKEEGKENQLVLSNRPRSASKASSLVQSPGRRRVRRRDMAITALAGGLTGLKHVAAVAGIPYVSPFASLLLGIINIRNASEMIQYQGHSEALADKLETVTTFLDDLGQEFPKARDLPQNLRNIFQKFESRLDRVKRELEQIKGEETSIVKKVILHKDMAQRLQQCDDKLSNLLQAFQTVMAMYECLKLGKANVNNDKPSRS